MITEVRGVQGDITIPQNIIPGATYFSLQRVVDSGITKYSQARLSMLIHSGDIPHHRIGDRVLFDLDQINELIRFENERIADTSRRGRKPQGQRKPKGKIVEPAWPQIERRKKSAN